MRAKTQVSFFTNRNAHFVQLTEFKAVGDKLLPYLIDISEVITEVATNQKHMLGVVRERGLNRPCSATKSTYIVQTLK